YGSGVYSDSDNRVQLSLFDQSNAPTPEPPPISGRLGIKPETNPVITIKAKPKPKSKSKAKTKKPSRARPKPNDKPWFSVWMLTTDGDFHHFEDLKDASKEALIALTEKHHAGLLAPYFVLPYGVHPGDRQHYERQEFSLQGDEIAGWHTVIWQMDDLQHRRLARLARALPGQDPQLALDKLVNCLPYTSKPENDIFWDGDEPEAGDRLSGYTSVPEYVEGIYSGKSIKGDLSITLDDGSQAAIVASTAQIVWRVNKAGGEMSVKPGRNNQSR
ncbi:MAG: hypothetical protein AAFX78_16295, partial [Cyanobacteria bacterium J06638_20]